MILSLLINGSFLCSNIMDNAEHFSKLSQILPAIGCIEFSEFSKHVITATLSISSPGDPLSALDPALC